MRALKKPPITGRPQQMNFLWHITRTERAQGNALRGGLCVPVTSTVPALSIDMGKFAHDRGGSDG